MLRHFVCFFLFLAATLSLFTVLSPVQAQDRKGGLFGFKKKENERPETLEEIYGRTYEELLKDSTILKPQLYFEDFNRYPYFYDRRQILVINKLKKENNYEALHKELLDYVQKFGPENFTDDVGILWDLARLSDHLGKKALAQDVFRLVMRHDWQRNLIPQTRYDSANKEVSLYVGRQEYYALLDKLKIVDTLRPPEENELDLGEEINSKFEDYGMALGDSDRVAMFTSTRMNPEDTAGIWLNTEPEGRRAEENIFFALAPRQAQAGEAEEESTTEESDSDEDGPRWQAAQAFPIQGIKIGEEEYDNDTLPRLTDGRPVPQLNSAYNEGSPCISPDGNFIIFSRCHEPGGLGNCDLYMVRWHARKGRWTEALNLGQAVNSASWESHPCFSITGDTLFFSSNRKGGLGECDIYFTVKDESGDYWMPAQNLGPYINTKKNEVSPFVHPKSGLLYFSSDGHPVNFGSFDIFKSYPLLKTWSEPKNIGPLMNTPGSEFYFTIDRKAKEMYYAKGNEENKNSDLYAFPMPMGAQPFSTVTFAGRVTEETTGEVFSGVVALFDLDEKTPIAPKRIADDGTFEFELVNKRRYMMIISGENFFRIEKLFTLDGHTSADIPAKSIKSLQFKSIEFLPGSARLLPEMENDLFLVMQFLQDQPDYVLRIEGHTDAEGAPEANLSLSEKRAQAIRDYIVNYGRIDKERIEAIGFGATKPLIFPEETEEHRRINRRVEFKLRPGGETGGTEESASEEDGEDGGGW